MKEWLETSKNYRPSNWACAGRMGGRLGSLPGIPAGAGVASNAELMVSTGHGVLVITLLKHKVDPI